MPVAAYLCKRVDKYRVVCLIRRLIGGCHVCACVLVTQMLLSNEPLIPHPCRTYVDHTSTRYIEGPANEYTLPQSTTTTTDSRHRITFKQWATLPHLRPAAQAQNSRLILLDQPLCGMLGLQMYILCACLAYCFGTQSSCIAPELVPSQHGSCIVSALPTCTLSPPAWQR